MENGAISDHQISASSEYEKIMNHKAFQGRLYFEPTPGETGSWTAELNNANQWLQVDVGTRKPCPPLWLGLLQLSSSSIHPNTSALYLIPHTDYMAGKWCNIRQYGGGGDGQSYETSLEVETTYKNDVR